MNLEVNPHSPAPVQGVSRGDGGEGDDGAAATISHGLPKLSRKFLWVLLPVIFLVTGTVMLLLLYLGYLDGRTQLRNNVASISEAAAITLATPIWSLNDGTVADIVASLSHDDRISCAMVLGAETGNVMAAAPQGCAAEADGWRRLETDIRHEEWHLGRLVTQVDESALMASLTRYVATILVVFVSLLLGVTVTASAALRRTVLRPLDRLLHSIRKADQGGRRERVDWQTDDELGTVIDAYNHMIGQVEERTDALEEARARAENLARAKSDFLAVMSHEIRTPMNGVVGSIELLRGSGLSREQERVASVVQDSAVSLMAIINDILDFSKAEAGHLRIAPEPTPLRRMTESVVSTFSAAADKKGIALRLSVEPDLPPWIHIDPVRLRQVLVNLIGNAVKFTDQGHVAVALEHDAGAADRLRLTVADTGIGMGGDELGRLFKPFSQASETTTRRFGGTGLGLSISKQLVELMDGTVEASSQPGVGSTFRVTLPLIESEAPVDYQEPVPMPHAPAALLEADMPPTEAAGRSVDGPLVLVAEDHPVNQWIIRSQLEQAGYAVDMQPDGRQAFEVFKNGGYAAVVTDYHMPEMDGVELVEAIRKLEAAENRESGAGELRRTPIVGLTADALPNTVLRCRTAGMDDLLTKPTSTKKLQDALAKLIGPANEPAPADPAPAAPQDDDAPREEPLFDPAIYEDFGGIDDQIRKLLGDYLERAEAHLQAMDAALTDREADVLAKAAHALAGSSLSGGATRLGRLCKAIQAEAADPDWPALATRVADARTLYQQTRQAILMV